MVHFEWIKIEYTYIRFLWKLFILLRQDFTNIRNKKSHLAVSITGQLETSGQKKICCQLNWIWMLKKEYIWIITLSAYQLIVCIKTLYFVKYGIENLISKVCIFYELLRGYLFL